LGVSLVPIFEGENMKLFYGPGACSMAAHIVANELGMNMEFVPVDLRKHEYKGGNYYDINPKGSVPALQMDNGEVLTEAAVILQYLADQKPGNNLLPQAGTMPRYRVMEWLNYISAEVHKGFGPLWNPATPEAGRHSAIENLNKKFKFISEKLGGKDYLMGAQYTVADAYLFTILGWTHYHKIDMTKFPVLMGYMERIKNRSAVMTTMKQEGLIQ
jgi:glutathione S-transferase